jgi:hypothetical protein
VLKPLGMPPGKSMLSWAAVQRLLLSMLLLMLSAQTECCWVQDSDARLLQLWHSLLSLNVYGSADSVLMDGSHVCKAIDTD